MCHHILHRANKKSSEPLTNCEVIRLVAYFDPNDFIDVAANRRLSRTDTKASTLDVAPMGSGVSVFPLRLDRRRSPISPLLTNVLHT